MGHQPWSGFMEEFSDSIELDDADMAILMAADLLGTEGYPAFFSVTDSLGFLATGPGEGLLYFFNRKKDMAFLFPQKRKTDGGPLC